MIACWFSAARRAGACGSAGLTLAFGSDHVFDAGQRQHVSQFGRIKKIRRDEHALHAGLGVANCDRSNTITLDVRPQRLVFEEDQEPSARTIGCQQFRQHRQRDPRLVAEPRYAAVTGVEMRARRALRRSGGTGGGNSRESPA